MLHVVFFTYTVPYGLSRPYLQVLFYDVLFMAASLPPRITRLLLQNNCPIKKRIGAINLDAASNRSPTLLFLLNKASKLKVEAIGEDEQLRTRQYI